VLYIPFLRIPILKESHSSFIFDLASKPNS
jgi:hypothetical protein